MRREKRYHYIYKTTCKITNKFYVGMHSTDNLEDGYLGSGKNLRYSIRKHGAENHEKEILEFLPNRSSLKDREKEIVNEQFLKDPKCMNIALGGGGGFTSKEHYDKFVLGCKNNGTLHKEKLLNDLSYKKEFLDRWKLFRKTQNFEGKNNGFYGKSHTDETKKKIGESNSISQLGERNSQFGSCWVTNGTENKKINKSDLIPEGWILGRKLK